MCLSACQNTLIKRKKIPLSLDNFTHRDECSAIVPINININIKHVTTIHCYV